MKYNYYLIATSVDGDLLTFDEEDQSFNDGVHVCEKSTKRQLIGVANRCAKIWDESWKWELYRVKKNVGGITRWQNALKAELVHWAIPTRCVAAWSD